MRIILAILILGCVSCSIKKPEYQSSSSSPVEHILWDQMLKKYVNSDGWVNYREWLKDRDKLNEYLSILSNNPPNSNHWSYNARLAYWINAYNAFTIALILDNYPLKSITELHPFPYLPTINTIWHKSFFEIGGQPSSLDIIEHKILRVRFNEPRIHFAIVCASYSCPKLRAEAYTETEVQSQLEDQAVEFINDKRRNIIDSERTKLSQIFWWFKRDFTKNGTLIGYINQYVDNEVGQNSAHYLHGLRLASQR